MHTHIHTFIYVGKNTTIRKAIRGHLDQNPSLERLLPHIKGNVGFVFTNEELTDVRDMIVENRVSQVCVCACMLQVMEEMEN